LASISAYLKGFMDIQVDTHSWQEDLQRILRQCGLDEKPTFLII
jgi:hypothetical protein